MRSEWQKVRLGDVAEIKTGKLNSNAACPDGKFPFFTCASVPLRIDCFAFDCEAVIVAGNCSPYMHYYNGKFNAYQRTYVVKPSQELVNGRWLYYWMKTLVKRLISGQRGSVEPYLVMSDFTDALIPLPPLATQQRIAAVLGALDDKIELNRKMNENLEAQAQALFKSWFVDFEPFGGKIPEGWKKGVLTDIAEYTNGLAMQKYRPDDGDEGLPVLKIKELRQGYCDIDSERCRSDLPEKILIDDGDVVFSWSGSLMVDFWCGGKAGLNQHLFNVTSEKYDRWFYFVWTKYHERNFAEIAAAFATTMGHIKRSELEKAEVLIPSIEDYKKIGALMGPICNMIISNRIESRKLAEMRDTLLPKLMKGEIEV